MCENVAKMSDHGLEILEIRDLAGFCKSDLLLLVIGNESVEMKKDFVFMVIDLDFGGVGVGHFL